MTGARSALGQYVHYYWTNYEKQGTRRWGAQEETAYASNFNTRIFADHKKQILRQAKNLKQPNLKKMENEYNKLNETQFKLLAEAFTKTKTLQGKMNLLGPMIKMINSKFSDTEVQEIVNNLYFDEKTQTIQYRPKNIKKIKSTKRISLNLKQGVDYRRINTLYTRANQLRQEINTMLTMGQLDDVSATSFLQEIDEAEEKGLEYVKNMDTLSDIHSAVSNRNFIRGRRRIDATELSLLFGPLELIASKISSVSKINEILFAGFAEILGEIVAKGAAVNGNKAIKEMFKDLKASGRTGARQTSGKQGLDTRIFMDIDQSLLEEEFIKTKENNQSQIIIKTEEGDQASFSFSSMDDTVSQKTDVSIVLQEKTAKLSIKNTDLSKIASNKDFIEPSISLQDSSLILFLLDMQNQIDNLGTHYLNILATHPDYTATYSFLRQTANESLTLALLYSSLSGAGQLRKGGQANILAIYDKAQKLSNGQPRIKFFDMYEIINKVSKSYGIRITHPAIWDLELNNDWVEPKTAYSKEAANTRITKLLLEARRKNIAISLSHNFLNSIYS